MDVTAEGRRFGMNATTDWFDVEALHEKAYRLTVGAGYLPCNVYLVGDGERWLTIDAALGIGDLASLVTELVGSLPPLFLTHRHWDHVGAAHQFETVTIHREAQTDGVVTTSPLTPTGTDLSALFLEEWRSRGNDLPNGFDPAEYEIPPIRGVEAIEPGEMMAVGSLTLETVPLPGHSPDQLGLLDRTHGICYAADILSPDGSVLAPFDDADLRAYGEAVQRLVDLRDEGAFETLATGHGTPLSGEELDVLDRVDTAISTVLEDAPVPTVGHPLWGEVHTYTVEGIDVIVQPDP